MVAVVLEGKRCFFYVRKYRKVSIVLVLLEAVVD